MANGRITRRKNVLGAVAFSPGRSVRVIKIQMNTPDQTLSGGSFSASPKGKGDTTPTEHDECVESVLSAASSERKTCGALPVARTLPHEAELFYGTVAQLSERSPTQIERPTFTLKHADCLDAMPTIRGIDAIVCDPPYGLGFMGKNWDHGVPGIPFWKLALEACKPGAHLLAFGGTRTFHRLAVAIEDAGWEIRDTLMWVYGSGFPKSLDVSKAIDKAAGAEREIVGVNHNGSGANLTKLANHAAGDTGIGYMDGSGKTFNITVPSTDAAKQWDGFGTALKPAWEPIILARKPLEGTVEQNVRKYGTGALNINACRIAVTNADDPRLGGNGTWSSEKMAKNVYEGGYAGERVGSSPLGRWPANVLHDGSAETVAGFPMTESGQPCGVKTGGKGNAFGEYAGSASRFFYCAKASRQDRDEGCEDLEACHERSNHHPTVKPTALMRYLCKLITPTGGTILDNFMGSGSTGKASMLEGFNFIGIEKEPEYLQIAEARIKEALAQRVRNTAQLPLL
jgi:site-specific DNA-methyltransferase (adenine-specific)